MTTFNVRIAAVALIGFVGLPGVSFAQAQPIAAITRLVPLDITGRYVVPALKPGLNPARFELLTADPFKEAVAAAATPVIAAPRLSVACVVALLCP